MAQQNDLFCHEPLNHTIRSIRVIQILPDLTVEGLVQCDITHTAIDSDYTCLSYMWGPEQPCQTIMLNGKLFTVRQNLYDFLQNVRPMVNPGNRTWIDAICIDQGNTTERNHQVQQMGEIFSGARCVYVWLGTLPSLPLLAKITSTSRWERRIFGSAVIQDKRRYLCRRDILRNPYWRRAWIIQEIVLAREVNVVLRTTILSFSDFLIAIGFPLTCIASDGRRMRVGPDMNTKCLSIIAIRRIVQLQPRLVVGLQGEASKKSDLSTLFLRFSDLECSVPRDRIFSLLSICHEGSSIKVDYEKDAFDLTYDILRLCNPHNCLCSVVALKHALSDTREARVWEDLTPNGSYIDIEMSNWKSILFNPFPGSDPNERRRPITRSVPQPLRARFRRGAP
ncbi:hypothetical protein ACN47E_005662 [Coniothyrium glycines]